MSILRYLLWMVLLPGTALAANPDCTKLGSTAGCTFGSGAICSFQWTATANANSGFLQTGSRPFSLRLEPHIEGSGTAATADVYACTRPAVDACSPLEWDSDGVGTMDNTLAVGDFTIGTPVFMGIPWIYLDPTANPVSGTAEIVVTGETQ